MKGSSLILKIVVGVIFLLAIVGMYLIATAGGDDTPAMASAASFVVTIAVGLLVIAGLAAVVSSVITLMKNPAGLKKTLLGLVVFAVFFVIAYLLASDAQVFGADGNALLEGTEKQISKVSKWSGTGLFLSYILLAIGAIGFVGDLLRSLIKS